MKYAALCAVPLGLIIVEPNLSTTICTALVLCLLIYIGGLSYKFIGTVLVILIPVAVIFLSIVVQPDQTLLKDYQQERILAFLEPEKYASDGAYQQRNSVMAIGSGQLAGKGLNNRLLLTPSKTETLSWSRALTLFLRLLVKNLVLSEAVLLLLYYY